MCPRCSGRLIFGTLIAVCRDCGLVLPLATKP